MTKPDLAQIESERTRAQEELRRTGGLLQAVADEVPDAIFVKDRGGKYLLFNKAASRLTGKPAAEVLGRDDTAIFDPDSARVAMDNDRRVMASGVADTREEELTAAGVTRTYLATKAPYRDEHGNVIGVIGISRDITKRKEAEKQSRAAAERLQAVIAAAPMVIWAIDRSGIKTLSVGKLLEKWGREQNELVGHSIFEAAKDVPEMLDAARRVLSGEVLSGVTTAGNETFEWWYNPLRAGGGAITGAIGVAIDVTDRKHAVESLRESEARKTAILRGALDAIITMDHEGKVRGWNPAAERIFGYSESEALGRPLAELIIPPALRPQHIQGLAHFLATGQGPILDKRLELPAVRADGSEFTVELSVTRIQDSDRPLFTGFVRDVTDLKRAKDALTLFRSLVNHANDAIEVIDPETGRFLDVNEKACLAHGFTREEYLALQVPDLDPTMSAPGAWAQNVDSIRRTGSRIFESQHRRRDGSVFPVEINVTYIRLDRDYLLAVVRDITERKQAEESLRRSERLLRLVLDALPVGVVVTNLAGDIILGNPASKQIWGGMIIDGAERCARSKGWRHGTGERIGPDEWASRRAFTQGQTSVNELIDIESFDGVRKIIKNSAAPIRDDNQTITGAVVINEDITDVLRLEDQFRQAQKMEAIGQLAGGVAHDFNNLLTIINGYSEIIPTQLPADSPVRKMVREIGQAGERAASLTRQLLAFSRKQVLEPKVLNLNALVTDTAKMLHRLLGEDLDLNTILEPALGRVKADPGQIEQVLMNLAVNARDAMPQGGKLSIETANATLDETYTQAYPDLRPGPYVMLAVSDTGMGMDEATKAHIFEPFFTTKGPGKGTGLGLATVHGIVKQSNGHIAVSSEPGRGTTFKIFLPLVAEVISSGKSHAGSKATLRGNETILLAEDEPAVRALTRHVLQMHGYTVLEAGQSDKALHIAEEYKGKIHLLVTDVVMPVMSGRQLAERLAAIRPGLRVLYLSGYTDDSVVRHGVLQAETAFLQKPFTPTSLATKVRAVLDEQGGEGPPNQTLKRTGVEPGP
jgi:PAS domain S-box-containing protein